MAISPAKARRPYRGVTCPRCDSLMGPGATACPRCGNAFEIVRFEPVEPRAVGASLAVAGPAEGTPCARHAGNRAELACGRCGQFMCGLCRIDTDGQSWCPACFERLSSEGALPGTARRFKNHARLAGTCLVGSILLWFLMTPFAGLGLYWSIQGIREKRRRNESDGMVELWIHLVLCVVFALGGIVLLLVIASAFAGGSS